VLGAGALAALIFGIINGETAGYTAASVLALFAVSLTAGSAFVLWERRAPFPLLDLSYLRVPRFTTPNVVAYCAYFATFAIFFFTALYLGVIVGLSGYRIALLFLPMTVMMIAAALLAGRWTTVIGARWLLVGGCLLFAGGLLLTTAVISPNPAYLPLAAALGLAGVGIGTCVGARGGPGRAVGDGRVGHEHQPGVRRGHRHRHSWRRGQRRAAVRACQPHDQSARLDCASGLRASGDRDGVGVPSARREHRRRAARPAHPGRVRVLHQRTTRSALPVGGAARGRSAAVRCHPAATPRRCLTRCGEPAPRRPLIVAVRRQDGEGHPLRRGPP
jgi:hypothetical protein